MTIETPSLKAPFPAFGGKGRVAHLVWERIGVEVDNFIEPFCFSAAVMLKRPGGAGRIETVNDRNGFVANFWRAVQADPVGVAAHADWPVSEVDLHVRHRWLVCSERATAQLRRVAEEPDFYDAKIAGWWCWGACCWIGSGWCDESHRNSRSETRPDIEGHGVTALSQQLPHMDVTGRLVLSPPNPRRPILSQAGHGLTAGVAAPDNTHRPQLADAFGRGRGVHANMEAMTCDDRRAWVMRWMLALADRLRPVRVCCGHWSRVCDSPSTMTRLGTTGVFLDPPYRTSLADGSTNRTKHIYASDRNQNINALCDEVQAWCLKWGTDPMVRLALCGLEGEYPEIERAGWSVVEWKSNGGYGNRNGANVNAERERIWFSPHCKQPVDPAMEGAGSLFGAMQ